MKQRLAQLLQSPEDRINLKAKTGEKVGPVGRKEAMQAEAVVLIQRTTTGQS